MSCHSCAFWWERGSICVRCQSPPEHYSHDDTTTVLHDPEIDALRARLAVLHRDHEQTIQERDDAIARLDNVEREREALRAQLDALDLVVEEHWWQWEDGGDHRPTGHCCFCGATYWTRMRETTEAFAKSQLRHEDGCIIALLDAARGDIRE